MPLMDQHRDVADKVGDRDRVALDRDQASVAAIAHRPSGAAHGGRCVASVGPEAPIDPPFAATPLTVSKSRCMSKVHKIFPSVVDSARNMPSQPPENTTHGIVETAAS